MNIRKLINNIHVIFTAEGSDVRALRIFPRLVTKRPDKIQITKDVRENIPYCLVVRIPGSHPGGPGSIPGMGKF